MKVEIKMSNASEIELRMQKRLTEVKKTLPRVMHEYLQSVQKTAKNIIKREAYDTGRLHESITIYPKTPSKLRSTFVGNVRPDMRTAPYAEFVHQGHMTVRGKYIPGVYYLLRAINYHKKDFPQYCKDAIITSFMYYGKGGANLKHPRIDSGFFDNNGKLITKRVVPRSQSGTKLARKRTSKKTASKKYTRRRTKK